MESLFETNCNICKNAYPNWRRRIYPSSDFHTYSKMYMKSADCLINSVGDNYDKRADEIIIPALFLYRHSIELILKAILLTEYLMDETISLEKIKDKLSVHSLDTLWKKARNIVYKYLRDDIKKDKKPLEIMDNAVNELNRSDPSSMIFRYPYNNEYTLTQKIGDEKKSFAIDYNALKLNIHAVYKYFEGVFDTIFNIYENMDPVPVL